MEVFTSNMTIVGIVVHSECPEVPKSRRNRERSRICSDAREDNNKQRGVKEDEF